MSLIGLAIALLTVVQESGAPAGLIWNGQPVHPGCIQQLTTDLADPLPVVAAVDLGGCQRSNRHSRPLEVDGRVLRWFGPDDDRRGYFQYEYLGVLSSAVHVIRVGESGGGSGFFQGLLFARISETHVLEDGQSRTRHVLTLVGSETLGDRAQASVSLAGNVVTIRRREFRGAEGMGPEETVRRTVR